VKNYPMLSLIIPSRKELFLNQTIKDVLAKATGAIEVLPILDGYEPEVRINDTRVRYISLPEQRHTQKRHGINEAVKQAKGEYVMSLDAHCMVAEGFDEILAKFHQPNWVQVPRRNRLDAENWCLQAQADDRPPIDYEYIMYPEKFTPKAFHGFKWDERTIARQEIMIDDIITFQGSCWFMTKEWFNKMGFMQIEGYTGWGQEAEEISFKTWANGGKCKINKYTWYAHLHKGRKYGRMYFMSRDDNRKSYRYSYEYWRDKPAFHDLINKFMPMPGWPRNWKENI